MSRIRLGFVIFMRGVDDDVRKTILKSCVQVVRKKTDKFSLETRARPEIYLPR